MRRLSAHYIFPVSGKPLKYGILEVSNNGTIQKLIDTGGKLDESQSLEFYNGILLPGFVNCHTHLELSWMDKKLPKTFSGMADFVQQLLALRNNNTVSVEDAIIEADQMMQREGIVAVGDICNKADTFVVKAKSPIWYYSFIEVFGLGDHLAEQLFAGADKVCNDASGLGLQAALSPHAPYTMSGRLFEMIKEWHENHPDKIMSLHFQEAPDEERMVRFGDGKLFDFFKGFGFDTSCFPQQVPTIGDYVKPFISAKSHCLFVHNTCARIDELKLLASSCAHAAFVVCPRSNWRIEQKFPDIQAMYNNNLNVVLGTDSLASCGSLSILDEMKYITEHYQEISLETLVQMATLNGAHALQMQETLGSFDTGKKPGVNLLTDVDFSTMTLLPETKVKKLI